MLVEMSPSLLRYISKTIAARPAWGLLLANEYLPPSSHLHAALVAKAQAHVGRLSTDKRPIWQEITAGKRLCQFTPAMVAEILHLPSCRSNDTFRPMKFLPSSRILHVRSKRGMYSPLQRRLQIGNAEGTGTKIKK